MIKTLIYAAMFTLFTAAVIPTGITIARTDDGKVPHIDSSVQFPPSRWRIVRHTIRLHVPQNSRYLSQLTIEVPDGLTASNNIDVVEQSGRIINANVSVNDKKVLIAFPEPIAPETKLNIAMRDVKISGVHQIWLYPVSAKLVGIDTDIPIGMARFRTHR